VIVLSKLLFCRFSQKSPLQNSAANEAEALAVFLEELDRYVDLLDKEEILFQSGAGDRKLSKWDQSIDS
jgi:hypothetical protein